MPKNKINCENIVIPLAFLYYFLLTKRNDNIFRSYIHVDNETVNVEIKVSGFSAEWKELVSPKEFSPTTPK